MYRDDPLDDEAELRAVIGDEPVDRLLDAPESAPAGRDREPIEVALDVLRVLQGWVDDDAAARWFLGTQARLERRTPIEALVTGAYEEVEDAARAWAAAQG